MGGHEMAPHTPSVRRGPAEPWRSSGLCRQPESLPRQQLPGAVLLLPDLKGADLGGGLLALELGLGQVDVARDRGIADHRHLELREGERLDGLLAGHHPVDELLLGLDPSVRMAVADLSECHLLQLGLVGFEQGLSQDLDALLDRRLVVGLSAREATEQKPGRAESKCACNHHVTPRYVHGILLDWVGSTLDCAEGTPSRIFRIVRAAVRTFLVVWTGQLVSQIGTAMSTFALLIWIYERTGRATTVALLGFFWFVPVIALAPLAGVWIDRHDRRR